MPTPIRPAVTAISTPTPVAVISDLKARQKVIARSTASACADVGPRAHPPAAAGTGSCRWPTYTLCYPSPLRRGRPRSRTMPRAHPPPTRASAASAWARSRWRSPAPARAIERAPRSCRVLHFGLALEPGDHFLHQRHHVPAIGTVRHEVAAPPDITEREHQQHETGLALGALLVPVEHDIDHGRDIAHRFGVLLVDRCVAQAFTPMQTAELTLGTGGLVPLHHTRTPAFSASASASFRNSCA